MNLLVTGATGLVGKAAIQRAVHDGHAVTVLARHPERSGVPAAAAYAWSSEQPVPRQALQGIDAVLHLAGESVAGGRWTSARKAKLAASRVDGTRHLVESFAALPSQQRPKILVAASGIGFYGDTGDRQVDESAGQGSGFLAELCTAWENEIRKAEELGIRTVILRFAMILSSEGGALAKMGPAIVGGGRQWISWIHIDDVIEMIFTALRDSLWKGVYNAASPHPETHRDFMKAFCRARGYLLALPLPAAVLKLALGEMSSLILTGQKAQPKRALDAGFKFHFEKLSEAFTALYRPQK